MLFPLQTYDTQYMCDPSSKRLPVPQHPPLDFSRSTTKIIGKTQLYGIVNRNVNPDNRDVSRRPPTLPSFLNPMPSITLAPPFKPSARAQYRHALVHDPLAHPEVVVDPSFELLAIGDLFGVDAGAMVPG